MTDDIPNQNNYQDDQNFDIDINKIYTDFIKEIDATRSFAAINVQDEKIFNALSQSGGTGDITAVAGLIKMEKTVQESRCHAFFRLIGLPIVSKDKKIYNPGFDIISDTLKDILTGVSTKKIKLEDKISIATNPIKGFNALSIKRELYPKNNLIIFSNSQSIDAGVTALSSGSTKKLRKFSSPMEDKAKTSGFELDPFDMDPIRQSYTVNTNSLVGDKEVLLELYQDATGNFPLKFSDTREHIIMPFVVDARIDFSVSPQSNLIAVPFISDQSFAKVSATEFVKRPLLEKIIRDRFANEDPMDSIGSATTAILDYIKTIPAIKDGKLVKLISSKDIYKQSIQAQFIQTFNIIKAMMKILVESKNIINKAQGDYYWVPVPSSFGPEGGSEIQGVFLPTVIDPTLITDKDKAILLNFAKDMVNSQNSQATAASSVSDNFALSTYKFTFGPDTSSALGDNNAQNLETLSQQRKSVLQGANDALRSIEIIMGEFSGFGLCDIIAIMGALNIMPQRQLLGFLDVDALARMNNSLGLDEGAEDYTDAITIFTAIVKDFYNLMDKVYHDLIENNGIS